MIRGAILIALVGIIVFIVLFDWSKDKRDTGPELYITHPSETLGEAIERDTDGDSVPDWEERLLDLDPKNPNTLGSDEDDAVVAERRREERRNDVELDEFASDTDTLNETDALTRDLYMAVASLSQGEQLNDTVIENLTALTSAHLSETGLARSYTPDDLNIVANTQINEARYINEYDEIISSYQPDVHPVAILNQIEETGDIDQLTELEKPIQQHAEIRDNLLQLNVPEDAVFYHITVINALESIINSINNMKKYTNDPILAMTGVFSYYDHMAAFANALEKLNNEYYQSLIR